RGCTRPAHMSAGAPSISHPVHETRPAVFLIARPALDLQGMRGYLDDVGGDSWLQRRLEETDADPNGAELLVEFAGRACYRSWEPGLNPNVRKVRTDQREYFANILRSAHGSVLEHANFSFALRNCGRVFTHELVRHRAGSAFSQESLRYVRLADIGFRVPPALAPLRERVLAIVEQLEVCGACAVSASSAARAGQLSSACSSSARSFSLAVTAGSRSVVTSPSSRPSAMSRSNRRMILPERVLGRSSLQMTRLGRAN